MASLRPAPSAPLLPLPPGAPAPDQRARPALAALLALAVGAGVVVGVHSALGAAYIASPTAIAAPLTRPAQASALGPIRQRPSVAQAALPPPPLSANGRPVPPFTTPSVLSTTPLMPLALSSAVATAAIAALHWRRPRPACAPLRAAPAGAEGAAALPVRRVKVYKVPGCGDAICVRLKNGEYHSLQPDPSRDDDEADAFVESFDPTLPACFKADLFDVMSEDDVFAQTSEIDLGLRAEDLGSMPSLGPEITTLTEAMNVLREEADALEDMHRQGWNYDGAEDGWCSASTGVVVEADGKVKVYILPEDDCAAAVRLTTGQYHLLRPRTEADEDLVVDTAGQELDEAWEKLRAEIDAPPDAPRPGAEGPPEGEEFRYVEAIEDSLVPPFSEKHTRLLRLADLQVDYDVMFGTDSFNYGESIDFTGATTLRDVAERLREKARELADLERRGWRVEGSDGQWLLLRMDLDWE